MDLYNRNTAYTKKLLTDHILKSICFLASIVFYGNSRNADWIFEKLKRPVSYLFEGFNLFYYFSKKPRIYNVVSLIVEPVFGCNLACSYCWHSITHYFPHKEKRPEFMPFNVFKKIVDEAPESVESIAFALIGEPLLHPDIHTMIRYAKDKGLRTVLYTNGILLSETMMERLNKTGLDVLTVSVEPDERNSMKHRGVPLERIRDKIRTAVSFKSPSLEVKLSVVVHQENVHIASGAQNQFRDLIRHIKLSPLIRYNGTKVTGNCIEPWRGSLSILTNGDVTPCCISAGYRPIPIGNVTHNTLNEIISGAEFRKCLNGFINGNRPEVCQRCRVFQDKKTPLRIPSLSRKNGRTG